MFFYHKKKLLSEKLSIYVNLFSLMLQILLGHSENKVVTWVFKIKINLLYTKLNNTIASLNYKNISKNKFLNKFKF